MSEEVRLTEFTKDEMDAYALGITLADLENDWHEGSEGEPLHIDDPEFFFETMRAAIGHIKENTTLRAERDALVKRVQTLEGLQRISDGAENFTLSIVKSELDQINTRARQKLESAGVRLESYGGNCPVQIEGAFEKCWFYFRARHDLAELYIAKTGDDYFDNPLHYIERDVDNAGWMPLSQAFDLVGSMIEEARAAIASDGEDG